MLPSKQQALFVKLLSLTLLVMWVSACQLTPSKPLSAYVFPELQALSQIDDFQLQDFKVLDDRSLIVWDLSRRAYLLILTQNDYDLSGAIEIVVTHRLGPVQVNVDGVISHARRPEPTTIARIYVLTSDKQIETVSDKIHAL